MRNDNTRYTLKFRKNDHHAKHEFEVRNLRGFITLYDEIVRRKLIVDIIDPETRRVMATIEPQDILDNLAITLDLDRLQRRNSHTHRQEELL